VVGARKNRRFRPSQNRIEHLRQKLRTPEGKAIYAKRRETVEPVFGQIKERRGFRRFLFRSLE
jgi:hypothetical protein